MRPKISPNDTKEHTHTKYYIKLKQKKKRLTEQEQK